MRAFVALVVVMVLGGAQPSSRGATSPEPERPVGVKGYRLFSGGTASGDASRVRVEKAGDGLGFTGKPAQMHPAATDRRAAPLGQEQRPLLPRLGDHRLRPASRQIELLMLDNVATLLFCYGSLLKDTGPANVEALRANAAELLDVARQVRRRQVVGVAAYKPPGSRSEKEPQVFDFVGMIGLPLVPCHEFPKDAPAAFFSVHAAKDSELPGKLTALIASGKPVLITDGLAERLKEQVSLRAANVHVLPVGGKPKSLLELTEDRLDAIRRPLLRPLRRSFQAPNRVALYLFEDRSWVIENFNDEPVTVRLDGNSLRVAARGWLHQWK